MATDFASNETVQVLLLQEALSDMKCLPNIIQACAEDCLTMNPNAKLMDSFGFVLQKLKNSIQTIDSARILLSASKTTSSEPEKNSTESKYSKLRKSLKYESMIHSPFRSSSISSLDLTEDLKRGITNLCGTSSIPISLICLHNYRCIMQDWPCWVTHTPPSDITRFDIVLPRKSRPTLAHVLTARLLGSHPRVFVLRWKNTSQWAPEFIISDKTDWTAGKNK